MPPEKLTVDSIPRDVLDTMQRIREAGHSVWIVGGALRDSLLGQGAKDWDLATDAAPSRVAALFSRVVPIGVRHGTIQVLTQVRAIEVTTVPSRGDEGILADLARRDFTVNAMAWSFPQGVILDPHGGRRDLERGVLRGVEDPARRFHEDPLRTLRAGRFVSAYGFRLDEGTFEALKQGAVGLCQVASERIREEWVRLLLGAGVVEGVDCMRRGGVIRETLPEMLRGSIEDVLMDDPEAALLHAARTVHRCPVRMRVRLAAFFHNLSRVKTGGPGGPEVVVCAADAKRSSLIADGILARWRSSARDRRDVVSLVEHQLTAASGNRSDAELRGALCRVGRELLEDWMDLADAHACSINGPSSDFSGPWLRLRGRIRNQLAAGFPLAVSELAVDGSDVMQVLGIPPGEAVGRVLRELHESVIQDPALNERKFLMDFLLKAFHK